MNPNRNRKYYASQSPRGFANEINVHTFPTPEARDAWVAAHEDDGGSNSAACGARSITWTQAQQIRRDRGDAATRVYNRVIGH